MKEYRERFVRDKEFGIEIRIGIRIGMDIYPLSYQMGGFCPFLFFGSMIFPEALRK